MRLGLQRQSLSNVISPHEICLKMEGTKSANFFGSRGKGKGGEGRGWEGEGWLRQTRVMTVALN